MKSKEMRHGSWLIYLYIVMQLELSGFTSFSIILVRVLKTQSKVGS